MANDKADSLSFEWDEQKRLFNIEKYRIDLEDAALAMEQPRLDIVSNRNGEVRTLAICLLTERLIAVVYTMRGKKPDHIGTHGTKK